MDARIDPLRVLGLRVGDAHVIRNAGATVSDDVLRSLRVSQSQLGTRRAIVMGHTDCAGYASDEAAESAVRDGLRRIRGSSAVPDAFSLDGLMYDVRDGTVRPVD
jgi:carbonic anhydrase